MLSDTYGVKALRKGEPEQGAALIRYVAKSFKFFRSYVTCAKNVVKGLDYVLLSGILSAEDAEGIRAEEPGESSRCRSVLFLDRKIEWFCLLIRLIRTLLRSAGSLRLIF